MPPKRSHMTLGEKVSIILELQKGVKQSELCRLKKLSSSTVSKIWNNRDKILELSTQFASTVKKARKCDFPLIDEALSKWLNVQQARNLPINGPILIEKAKELAKRLNEPNFKGSDGWFDGWKRRHGVKFGLIWGESGSVDPNVVENWLVNVWPKEKEGYEDKDIYNADEFALFFKLVPNKTWRRKNQPCTGGKLSKERITVLACANAAGSDKLKLLVIGKSENPRPFKNVKKSSLPVQYFANKTAWMKREIFAKWLRNLNMRMKRQNRKILLLVDNCKPHNFDERLSNVKLVYLPANVTARLQPMDQGIINDTKRKYRTKLIKKLIQKMDRNQPAKIDILDSILLLDSAWKDVTETTVKNCFFHSKISTRAEDILPIQEEPTNEELDPSWLARLEFGETSMEDYINVDNDVVTYELPTEDSIVNQVMGTETVESENEGSDGDGDVDIERPHVTVNQAEDNLENLKFWLLCQDQKEDENSVILSAIYKIEKFIGQQKYNHHNRQMSIKDYFFKATVEGAQE